MIKYDFQPLFLEAHGSPNYFAESHKKDNNKTVEMAISADNSLLSPRKH